MKKQEHVPIDEEIDALRIMVQQMFRVPQEDARNRMIDYLVRRFRSAKP